MKILPIKNLYPTGDGFIIRPHCECLIRCPTHNMVSNGGPPAFRFELNDHGEPTITGQSSNSVLYLCQNGTKGLCHFHVINGKTIYCDDSNFYPSSHELLDVDDINTKHNIEVMRVK